MPDKPKIEILKPATEEELKAWHTPGAWAEEKAAKQPRPVRPGERPAK